MSCRFRYCRLRMEATCWQAFRTRSHRETRILPVSDPSTTWLVKLDAHGAKQWDATFGGTGDDFLSLLQPTPDGGYILGGYSSSSASGNKESLGFGLFDIWLVKVDPHGQTVWEASFGGHDVDILTTVQPTSDGGWLIAGESGSSVSGNKASPGFGGRDYWLVKIDAQGKKLWDVSFGGSGDDGPVSLQPASSGRWLLAGTSSSPTSGNKASPGFGGRDYWLVEFDAQGGKLKEVSFGGEDRDIPFSLQPTFDEGWLLAGVSRSIASGNKESDGFGGADFWLVKVDAQGSKLWDSSFGKSGEDHLVSLKSTSDGCWVLAGSLNSHRSGDYWLIKADSQGGTLWEATFGGTNTDSPTSLQATPDGGWLLGGNSDSPASGNKESSGFGNVDCWLVKVDAQGGKMWEAAFGGTGTDNLTSLHATPDGGWLLVGNSGSPTSGNKESSGFGNVDCWLIKLQGGVNLKSEDNVISWKADLGSVLEFSSNLDGEWEPYNSRFTNVGDSVVMHIDLAGGNRFYRLRKDTAASGSNNVPSLAIGVLLTWPAEDDSILEMSTRPVGPWEAFQGVQGPIDDQMAAIISQDQTQNYFRTRKTN